MALPFLVSEGGGGELENLMLCVSTLKYISLRDFFLFLGCWPSHLHNISACAQTYIQRSVGVYRRIIHLSHVVYICSMILGRKTATRKQQKSRNKYPENIDVSS